MNQEKINKFTLNLTFFGALAFDVAFFNFIQSFHFDGLYNPAYYPKSIVPIFSPFWVGFIVLTYFNLLLLLKYKTSYLFWIAMPLCMLFTLATLLIPTAVWGLLKWDDTHYSIIFKYKLKPLLRILSVTNLACLIVFIIDLFSQKHSIASNTNIFSMKDGAGIR